MTESIKFDPKKLEKLNNPDRVKTLNPDLIWETLNMSNPEVLVDIGAGTGFFASLFCKRMSQGKIYACDTADIMINWMKENLSKDENCSIILTKCEENSISVADEVADLVYLINLYHELEEPKSMLLEAYRLLKNGGKIAVIDWKPEETPEGPPVKIRISENIVFNHLEDSGFKNIKNHTILPYHYFFTGEKL